MKWSTSSSVMQSRPFTKIVSSSEGSVTSASGYISRVQASRWGRTRRWSLASGNARASFSTRVNRPQRSANTGRSNASGPNAFASMSS